MGLNKIKAIATCVIIMCLLGVITGIILMSFLTDLKRSKLYNKDFKLSKSELCRTWILYDNQSLITYLLS